MPIPKALLNEIYDKLQAVSDSLSKVQDVDWNDIFHVQGHINDSQDIVSGLLDKQGA